MAEFIITCNCGNNINYSTELTETVEMVCDKCGKRIVLKNEPNRQEVLFL